MKFNHDTIRNTTTLLKEIKEDVGTPLLAGAGALVAAGAMALWGIGHPKLQEQIGSGIRTRAEVVMDKYPGMTEGITKLGDAACTLYNGADDEIFGGLLPGNPYCQPDPAAAILQRYI